MQTTKKGTPHMETPKMETSQGDPKRRPLKKGKQWGIWALNEKNNKDEL